MKKIMFAIKIYEIGGASTVARNLMEGLAGKEDEIVLLTEKMGSRHYPVPPGVRLIDLDINPRNGLFAKIRNILNHLKNMRAVIVSERPDAIISFSAQSNCYLLLSLLFLPTKRPRIILTEHTQEIFLTQSGNPKSLGFIIMYRTLMSSLYHRADYVIAVSRSIERHLKKMPFVPASRIKVIYNPVDVRKGDILCRGKTGFETFKDRLPCIGTVSRLSPEKGISFLIEGFRDLADKIDSRLFIIGDGAERQQLEHMTGRLGLNGKVVFTGWVEDPFRYLARMDIFILPSLWEGFPNVVLEAMACGVPVIAADSEGGIREVIKNGRNGILIKAGSSKDIASAAYELLSDGEKRRLMAEEARKGLRQYDLDEIRRQYAELLYN